MKLRKVAEARKRGSEEGKTEENKMDM